MKLISCTLLAVSALAQRPTNPALLVPQDAPPLDIAAMVQPLVLPAGRSMGAPASVGFDSQHHIFILNRGPQALAEFDAQGQFIRLFGDGLLKRAHGLTIDKADNIWVTDVEAHVVMKLNQQGKVLLTLGTAGEAGEWNEATGSHHFDQPTSVALGRNGDVFVAQGHNPAGGDARVLKFDAGGKFIKSWGGRGSEPGKFTTAHGIAIDAQGLVWVADRENQRIQVFDQDGKLVREMKYAGLPSSISIGERYIYMVNGYAGQLVRMDLSGKVLAAVGKSGKGPGEFGEAHEVTEGPNGDVWVADTVNSAVQKFVMK
ncbi:MAG: peptidyl-alpha-hydroxyglycine alpha-amidating lyase family protein [Acidobacteriota bacterium]|nr:peptidyl-alpha-hydroxyglycine alpha-amidating lyase family protein [Acidobacteriota bacterium]